MDGTEGFSYARQVPGHWLEDGLGFDWERDQVSVDFSAEPAATAGHLSAVPGGTILGKVTATGVYKVLAPAANDGTQIAQAILFDGAKNVAATKVLVVTGNAIGNAADVTWPSGISNAAKSAAILNLHTNHNIRIRP